MFTVFNEFPTEIRLAIWALACDQEPRALDVWTHHQCGEENHKKFQLQIYTCMVSNKVPPSVLQASREAREVGLKHYTLEFKTVSTPPVGASHKNDAKFYVNYATDTLVPRGDWNPTGFWDFIRRTRGKMEHIAIDVTGSFWTDNVKECIETDTPLFQGLQEILLYSGSISMLEESSSLRKESKHGVQHDLSFVETPDTGRLLDNDTTLLSTYLNSMNKEKSKSQGGGDTGKVSVKIMKLVVINATVE